VRRQGLDFIFRGSYSALDGRLVDLRDHKGGGLEGDIDSPAELKWFDRFRAAPGQEESLQPFVKWDVAALEHCACSHREQLSAAITLARAGLSTGSSQETGSAIFAAMWTHNPVRPHAGLDKFERSTLIFEAAREVGTHTGPRSRPKRRRDVPLPPISFSEIFTRAYGMREPYQFTNEARRGSQMRIADQLQFSFELIWIGFSRNKNF
jgi:hypothetical protein